MKQISLIFFAFVFLGTGLPAIAQTTGEDKQDNTEKVMVYYFHYSRRCATCNAVESVSKEAVAALDKNKVKFADFNLDEETGETKGKELEVSGQTLLIVSGDKKINITNEAFMNARSNPDKLKALIVDKIEPLL